MPPISDPPLMIPGTILRIRETLHLVNIMRQLKPHYSVALTRSGGYLLDQDVWGLADRRAAETATALDLAVMQNKNVGFDVRLATNRRNLKRLDARMFPGVEHAASRSQWNTGDETVALVNAFAPATRTPGDGLGQHLMRIIFECPVVVWCTPFRRQNKKTNQREADYIRSISKSDELHLGDTVAHTHTTYRRRQGTGLHAPGLACRGSGVPISLHKPGRDEAHSWLEDFLLLVNVFYNRGAVISEYATQPFFQRPAEISCLAQRMLAREIPAGKCQAALAGAPLPVKEKFHVPFWFVLCGQFPKANEERASVGPGSHMKAEHRPHQLSPGSPPTSTTTAAAETHPHLPEMTTNLLLPLLSTSYRSQILSVDPRNRNVTQKDPEGGTDGFSASDVTWTPLIVLDSE
ncbi:hypothetical protein FRC01_013564 [Tulasnella sp. 417]|nr:hypothetical protein FRC01_013564 [Tulasnella sp. 417]